MTHLCIRTWRSAAVREAVFAIVLMATTLTPGTLQAATTGTQTGNTGSTIASAAGLADIDVYRLGLLKMKGHIGIARTLLQLRTGGADYHLHPSIRNLFHEIDTSLTRRHAPLTEDALELLERATTATPQVALATIESVAGAIDGSFAQTGAMNAGSALSLSAALLRDAVILYSSAVTDNEVVDVRRYRTGRGYVLQAEAIVRHATGLRNRTGHEALLASVVLIRQAWPGVSPPPIVFSPPDVAARLQDALSHMETMK